MVVADEMGIIDYIPNFKLQQIRAEKFGI